ncbi:hypothetical protein [Natronococcus jeotgali]|uniref:Uncharacterized protein n=1 Tax=Natronococcus jeotgali DSM 18795 TaxID=1227498 RepID=L9XWF5_9EURY|nr:hypothetical protein [Natronococcus jeotgali]ELY65761.1 hypothetical protein C492_02744 [Natronococcus jeotgali DSM 18795]
MGSDDCRMRDCPRAAERTMTFRSHENVAVCERHYRRAVAIKYGVLVALSVVLAGLGLAAYWLLA